MQVNCPECHSGIELDPDSSLAAIDCDTCGSNFSIIDEEDDLDTIVSSDTAPTLGRFKLVYEVGKGAFGSVWQGKDPELDRMVAIKIPRKENLRSAEAEKFFREARAAAQLKHPNIVPVHEIGKDNDTIFIVSDFVEGLSLDQRLSIRRFDIGESIQICVKICEALQHAHDHGVVHRDLKPSNIMLDDEGQPHIMDFGLAKREAGEITMTTAGEILGTPAYMSPEQAGGSAHKANAKSDIYSVGVILFELLTGELPFRGNLRMLLHQVINEQAPSVLKLNSNVSKDLATITAKCLEKEPDKRYSNCRSLVDDLQRYQTGKPINARPITRIETAWRWFKRKPALGSAMATSLFLLLVLAVGGPLIAVRQSNLKQDAVNAKQLAESNEKLAKEKTNEADEARSKAEKAQKSAEYEADTNAEMLQIVTDSFASVGPSRGATYEMTAKEVLENAKTSLDQSDLDDKAKAKMLHTLTNAFLEIAQYQSAVETAQQATDLRTNTLGANHPDTLSVQLRLARGYQELEQLEKSTRLYRAILQKYISVFGADHLETLNAKDGLASVFYASGLLKESLELREKIYTRRLELQGKDHNDTHSAMNNLAISLLKMGQEKRALKLFREVYQLRQDNLGNEHPDTLAAMLNLGNGLDANREFNESLDLKKKALDQYKTVFGPVHPETVKAMLNLSSGYSRVGRIVDAIAMKEKALKIARETFGNENSYTIRLMNNLAFDYLRIRRAAEALTLREEAAKASKKTLGIKHPTTLRTMDNLGVSRFWNDELEEAIKIFQQTLGLREEVLGKLHTDTIFTMANLANAHRKNKNFVRSIELSRAVFERRKEAFGAEHPDTLLAMNKLGDALFENGDKVEAMKIRIEALVMREKAFKAARENEGDKSARALMIVNNLAYSYDSVERYEEALEYFKLSLEMRGKALGNFNIKTLTAKKNFRDALIKAGKTVDVFLRSGNFEKANSLLNAMATFGSLERDLVTNVSHDKHVASIGQREWQSALVHADAWEKSLKQNNKNSAKLAEIQASRAVCYLELDRLSEAHSAAQQVKESKSTSPEAVVRANSVLAFAHAIKNDSESASQEIADVEKYLEANSKFRWPLYRQRVIERVIAVLTLLGEDSKIEYWKSLD